MEAFPETIAALNEDPGRVLTGLEVEKVLGPDAALVRGSPGGKKTLLETSVPVESELGGEGRQPVDLALERSGDGYVPVNPIAELELPGTAEGAIRLHDGLKVHLPADDGHDALPLGEENLFIPETEQSTDTILSPVAGGVEVSEQLRSEESSHELTFELELPEGAALKPRGDGGAEIVSDAGSLIEEIPPPSAVDAQGAPVPVDMHVKGDDLVLDVAGEGESSYAYPILVDPWYVEEGTNFGAWVADSPGGYGLRDLGSSLNAYSEAYRLYGANTWSQWVYTAPGETAFVDAATFKPVDFLVGGCYTAQPHGYIGVYNVYKSSYGILGVYSGGNSESEYQTGWNGEFGDRYATIGMGDGNESVAIPCYHEIYVGGYSIQLGDDDLPTWNSFSYDTPWMNETPVPITVSATDTGLGVKSYYIETPNSSNSEWEWAKTENGCAGTYASPCPRTWEPGLTDYRPQFLPTGETEVELLAEDPVENQSSGRPIWIRVDHKPPALTASGPLTTQTKLGMSKPEYTLRWHTEDGVPGKQNQSGVANVVVEVDGTVVHSETPSCSGSTNCSTSGEWNFVASAYSEGKHVVTVVSTDAVGNQATQKLEVSDTPEVTSPKSGERTSTRLKLAAAWRQSGYSGITWQYRLGTEGAWMDVPAAEAYDASGEPVAWPATVEGQESRPIYWNVAGSDLSTKDVVELEVRAVLEGGSNPTGDSEPVAAELNRASGGPKDASSPVGPGNLDLVTGNLSVPRTDVSIPVFGTSLEFSRTYNSKEAEKDPTGVLGPGWISGSPVEEAGGADWKSLRDAEAAEEGPYVILTDLEGYEYPFERLTGGEYLAPPEAVGWTLSEVGNTFVLADPEGNQTEFGTEAEPHVFLPTAVTQLGGTSKSVQMVKTQMAYELTGSNRRLKLLLGPSAEGVGCTSANATTTLGCRSLSFTYQHPSEWGGLAGAGDRLTSITYNGPYSSSSGATEDHWEVARYVYDKEGRLTEEWDPRIEPPLKEVYAYDGTHHLRSVTPAGQEPWVLGYEEEPPGLPTPAGPGEDPVAAWSFDEEGATQEDMTGDGNTASVEGATWTPHGRYGGALEFDGEESCVKVPDSPVLQGGEEFTVEAWVRPAATREFAPIFFKKDTEGNYGYALWAAESEDGNPAGEVNDGTYPDPGVEGDAELPPDVWSHVALTYDGSHMRLYVAGELVATGSSGAALASDGPLEIGCADDYGYEDHFEGRIDEARVYERALSAAEIAADMEAPLKTAKRGPVAAYSFDEGKGATVADSSGNGHTATIEGAEWTTQGRYGGALEFDGSKSCVKVPDSSQLQAGEEFSLEAWVRPDAVREFLPLFYKQRGEDYAYGLWVDEAANGIPAGEINDGSWPIPGVEAKAELPLHEWSYLALTYDGAHLRLYVDGELVATGASGAPLPSEGPLDIGCASVYGYEDNFEGAIDEARVYDRAIDQSEIGEDEAKRIGGPTEQFRLHTVRRASLAGGSEPATAQTTVAYGVPLEGGHAPYAMGKAEVSEWGQKDVPVAATAIFPPDEVPARKPTAYTRATIFYTDDEGQLVNTASPSGSGPLEPAISTTEADEYGNIVRELSIDNRLRSLSAGAESVERSEELDTERVYNSEGTELLEDKGPLHEVMLQSGSTVEARLHDVISYEDSEAPKEEGVPEPHLPTKEVTGAEIPGGEEAENRVTEYRYDWKVREPTDTIVDPGGLDIQTKTVYDDTTGLPVEQRQPSDPEGGGPGTTKTVYYKATGTGECEGKPQYAGLPCKITPAAQTSATGRPELIVTSFMEYDQLGEPTEVRESPGGGLAHVRTMKSVYDSAGRQLTSHIEGSGEEVEVPKTKTIYSESLGLPAKQEFVCESGCSGFESRAVSTTYDRLGRVVEYEDASGDVAKTDYDLDGRPARTEDAKGSQAIAYGAASGLPTTLEDSGAGTFTATYDAEGNLLDRTLPDGLTGETSYNPMDEQVHLAYTKESSTWLGEDVKRSIYGQILVDKGTLVDDSYSYDKAGRLIEAQETPSGGSCTRAYSYDADSNRTADTTHEVTGGCTGEGGGTQKYAYDAADRLEGEGLTYDSFGRVTNLPAAFAGGSKVETDYFSTNMVASQSQGGVTNTYKLDATLRQDGLSRTGGGSEGEEVFHFDGPTDSASWTSRGTTWSREVVGIGGELAAVEESSGTTTFALTDLHGDVVATAAASPTATKLLGTARFSEFGEPESGSAGRFGWLGGKLRRTELESGVIQMGARSYVPAIGRFLSPDPVPGGSANSYDYGNADPVNAFDPSGTKPSDVSGSVCRGDLHVYSAGRHFHAKYKVQCSLAGYRVEVLKVQKTFEVHTTSGLSLPGHSFVPKFSSEHLPADPGSNHWQHEFGNWNSMRGTTFACTPGTEYQYVVSVVIRFDFVGVAIGGEDEQGNQGAIGEETGETIELTAQQICGKSG